MTTATRTRRRTVLTSLAAAISTDGSTTILGSPSRYTGASANSSTARPGAAYIYSGIPQGNGSTRTEDAILVANDAPGETVNDRFGAAVDISGDGSVAVVGAPHYGVSLDFSPG